MRTRPYVWLLALACGVVGAPSVAAATATTDAAPKASPVVVLSHIARRELRASQSAPNSPSPDGDAVTTSVSVRVVPGPLTVVIAPEAVRLRRVGPSTLEGTVRKLRVVDARSAYAGWDLGVRVIDAAWSRRGHVDVRVDRVVATADTTDGIDVTPTGRRASRDVTPLVRAEPGFGAGAYDVTFTITVRGVRTNARDAAVEFDLV